MTTTFVNYEDYMASLGWPDHQVMVGPDWWGCLCGVAGWNTDGGPVHVLGEPFGAAGHASDHNAEMVSTDWGWDDVSANRTMADVHQWLWEGDGFTE